MEEPVLSELVEKVYGSLESGGLLGRQFRYRSHVLRTVFRLVDREHGPLLASLAKVMLAVSTIIKTLFLPVMLCFILGRQQGNYYSVIISSFV